MTRLDVQFSTSPVSSLGVVTDSVVGSQSNPLWQWTVGVLSLSQFLLGLERFLRLCCVSILCGLVVGFR